VNLIHDSVVIWLMGVMTSAFASQVN